MSDSDSNINMLNSVTNDLLLKYDENFNKLYDKKLGINSSIMNKEELIIKENDEIQNKNNTLTILQYTNIAIIIYGILLIFYGLERINYGKLIKYTILLIFVYVLIIIFTLYVHISRSSVINSINGVKVQMTEYIDTVIADELNYKCPATCTDNDDSVDKGKTLLGYAQPTLKTDPQLDVWKYGDMPTDLYTSPENPASTFYSNTKNIPNYRTTEKDKLINMPKPFFNSINPSSTYYQCQWNGGDTNNGDLPNVEQNKYSSIPCSYRPNFTEVGRYICTTNPNNLSGSEFNNVCDSISIPNFQS
jgi:hypothetical protein